MTQSLNMYQIQYVAPNMAVSRKKVETTINSIVSQTVSRDWFPYR